MGTNYYVLVPPPEEPDEPLDFGTATCDKPEPERVHIGKSSGGWVFALHAIPEWGLNSLIDWLDWFALREDLTIVDECDDPLTLEDLLRVITDRSRSTPLTDPISTNARNPMPLAEYLALNHAVRGPNNLLRHKIGRYCLAHGEGTWDLIPGEFS